MKAYTDEILLRSASDHLQWIIDLRLRSPFAYPLSPTVSAVATTLPYDVHATHVTEGRTPRRAIALAEGSGLVDVRPDPPPWCEPPLRWVGGKRRLVPRLRRLIPATCERIVEPFAGSAALFFASRPHRATLADTNSELIQFYEVVQRSPRRLARGVAHFVSSNMNFYDIRALSPAQLSPIDRAARFLYLNRHCYNGVYRTNRQNQFNVPLGTRAGSIPSAAHLYRCSYALRGATLLNASYDATTYEVGPNDFVYLDPPFNTTSRNTYGEYGYGAYNHDQFLRLVDCLSHIDNMGGWFALSYQPLSVEERSLLSRWSIVAVQSRYHVAAAPASRLLAEQVLVTNCSLGTSS